VSYLAVSRGLLAIAIAVWSFCALLSWIDVSSELLFVVAIYSSAALGLLAANALIAQALAYRSRRLAWEFGQ
tara:strand:- start:268 stop:483 length:216 start_codon:yes stop_codon:yes gene_type:complete